MKLGAWGTALQGVLRTAAITGVISMAGAGISRADIITFNFNSLANNASNNTVQTHMNGILGAGKSVVVTNAKASNSYDGDDHVVGPNVMGWKSLTLGRSDGTSGYQSSADTFLRNANGTDRIIMQFSGFQIYGVSFDYEIFPDGNCPDYRSSSCDSPSDSNWPDFKFEANDVLIFEKDAVIPGQPGVPYTRSPASNTERAPQFLGVSGAWLFPTGVTKLEFIDWPSTIGIDNLVLSTTTPPPTTMATPEPGSIVLFGTILLGVTGLMRRRFRRN